MRFLILILSLSSISNVLGQSNSENIKSSLESKMADGKALSKGEQAQLEVLKGGLVEFNLESIKVEGKRLSKGEKALLKALKRGASMYESYLVYKWAEGITLTDEEKKFLKIDQTTPATSFICVPNNNETECVTPDGRVFKLQTSVNQGPRALVKEFGEGVNGPGREELKLENRKK